MRQMLNDIIEEVEQDILLGKVNPNFKNRVIRLKRIDKLRSSEAENKMMKRLAKKETSYQSPEDIYIQDNWQEGLSDKQCNCLQTLSFKEFSVLVLNTFKNFTVRDIIQLTGWKSTGRILSQAKQLMAVCLSN